MSYPLFASMLVLLYCLSPLIPIGAREESGPFILRRKSLKSELSSGTEDQRSTGKTTASLSCFLQAPEGVIPLGNILSALQRHFFWKNGHVPFHWTWKLESFSQVSFSYNNLLPPKCCCRSSFFFKFKWEFRSALLLCNSNGIWPVVYCHWKI